MAIPEMGEKCLPKCLFHHIWPRCDLCLDRLTSVSNQFIFVPNCIEVANLDEFPQVVCEIAR